jgi:imidazole glycerol-phosphate synthase subunit HisF
MMSTKRIIPRLDIKGPNLVKGIHLEGLRVLGKPEDFARHYYQEGADELVYMDVVASLYDRNSLYDIIVRTAKEIFIPLTVGGGLRSLEDIQSVLRAGADKVALNTAVIKNPDLIKRAAHKFGSSTIVISIEAIKKKDGKYEAFTDNGRQQTGVDAIEWALRAEALGAGEILVTSIDREGTGKGYDLELIERISSRTTIPVIACGGAGQVMHIRDVFGLDGVQAAAVASMLHYKFIESSRLGNEDFEGEGNIEFLKSGKRFTKISPMTIPELKESLLENNILCRKGWGQPSTSPETGACR